MHIVKTHQVMIPDTYEQRIHFEGWITPELIQDVIHNSFGMSYEKLGKMIIDQLHQKEDMVMYRECNEKI